MDNKKPVVKYKSIFEKIIDFALLRLPPNEKVIELEITTECNLACYNCDRSCRQAPSKESMTLEQISRFLDESRRLNKKWDAIKLLGGEPTLHKDLQEIFRLLIDYKNNFSPKTNLFIFTNGFRPDSDEFLGGIPEQVFISNSYKKTIKQPFDSFNVAPVDLPEFKSADFTRGCWIANGSGMALTRYGYYPCGAGAGIDRVHNFNIGIKGQEWVTSRNLKKQMKVLCRYCGHYKQKRRPRIWFSLNEEKMSPSWIKAYEAYKKEKPVLDLY